ncbi:hypothetical protein HPP92_013781 [Vanilla planifolia]|uniref:CBM20 domain-containing protein n=1 Tax=Vanilla planifolia TaxID=51239 RepID=A0A835QVE1_VANPL|nr:hypothetical protein HPP92_013781 [Vanilla planifolia]
MGSGSSKDPTSSHDSLDEAGDCGGQLYVSLKMENFKIRGELIPHVFGSVPIIGSWDPSRALPMARESASMWELSFVVPPNHEPLHFLFLLKEMNEEGTCVVEEGMDRLLAGGNLDGDARAAVFRPPQFGGDVVLEFKYASTASLELDLESYVVPTPLCASATVYAANLAETPWSLGEDYNFSKGLHGLSSLGGLMMNDATSSKEMPAAAGAVAAAAVADQMHGPKEERCLAIVLVGLPARGKTFTAAKLTRYLRWLGHETKHFNVGKYRRLKHGTSQTADFFRADNQDGMEARNEVAALAMDNMLAWMQEGGQIGIFDATNSTRQRRNMLMKMAEGKCKIIFLETICNDERIIERNMRLKIQKSPDYAEVADYETGLKDFKERLCNYEKVYEPVEEGSYIKMIDMVSGRGGQLQINNISGYLPGRIVFFLVNSHLTPRPILLTRHGESQDNVRGRIGGDSVLSEAGIIYSKKLANFVGKRLKSEKTASIWTSTLQRTIITAAPIVGFPKIQWRALDEINAGVCDGMSYEEIKRNMPEEYESRKKDKLRYRYPRGESYLDVIQRLEPVIIELERQRAPVVVISHQAVLRALYAYFADRPLKEIADIEVPLHTIIEIQMGVTGVQEKRYKLMD